LVSLPEEIGRLKQLIQLVSVNFDSLFVCFAPIYFFFI